MQAAAPRTNRGPSRSRATPTSDANKQGETPRKEAIMATYRVKINGFRVIQETYDDLLERDGKRDEVQISVITTLLDKDGKLIGVPSEKTTPIMGDTNRLANRIQAGSASSLGGLRTGDSFPDEPMPWLPA